MKNFKFSIIVPVFNTAKYLRECIDSVISQNYSNFELLLIDDGSTDTSIRICKDYQKKYPNIKCFFQQHEGVSHSRNVGIENSNGDYIVFLDSDDYLLSSNFFSYLNKELNDNSVDCFIGNFECKSMNKVILPIKDKFIDSAFVDGVSHRGVLDYIYRLRLVYTVWRFVVKADIIRNNQLYMVDNIIHEDEEWCVRMLLACKTFKKIPFPHYMYRKRLNSIMSTGGYFHYYNYLKVCELILHEAEKQKVNYKKIFAQRCAYKCAGQVYYGLKDISNFKPPIKAEGEKNE